LVEPQRTNLALRSEEFNDASWLLIGATTSANIAISPSGTTNADELIGDGTDTSVRIRRTVLLSAGVHTFSCFLKSGTDNFAFLEFSGFLGISGTSTAFFDLANGTTPTSGASIENYGNGWYRCSISATIDLLDTSGSVGFRVVPSISTNSFPTVGDANGKSILAWGAQLEAGSNATSYIPTVATAVTRNQDMISKTGISDLIGQTEGTLFVDYNKAEIANSSGILELGEVNNEIVIWQNTASQLRFFIRVNGSVFGSRTFNFSDERLKIALTYQTDSYSVFLNGVKILENIGITSLSSSYNGFILGNRFTNSALNAINSGINLTAIFKTQLTDQECINLTTL
jgi:hypothetical protein